MSVIFFVVLQPIVQPLVNVEWLEKLCINQFGVCWRSSVYGTYPVRDCMSFGFSGIRPHRSCNFGGVDSENLQGGRIHKTCATRTLLCDRRTIPKSQKVPSGRIFSSCEDSESMINILIWETTISIELEEVMLVVVVVEIVTVVDVAI